MSCSISLLPRILVDVSKIDLSTTILGHKVSSPILIAPSAMQKMAHPDGELATARAAEKLKTGVLTCVAFFFSSVSLMPIPGMVLSSWSTTSLEDVAKANGDGLRWFQLYVYKVSLVCECLIGRIRMYVWQDRKMVEQLVRRAEAAGYTAIALTVDTPYLGRRSVHAEVRVRVVE